jgi:uncharacterized membrane protein
MLRASDYRAKAREALNGNWTLAVIIVLVMQVLIMIINSLPEIILAMAGFIDYASIFTYNEIGAYASPIGSLIYWALLAISGLITYSLVMGYVYFNINLIKGTDYGFENLFARFYNILKNFGLYFMIGVFTILWSLLFIIPGIIASYSYSMAPYIMAEDPDVGVFEAIRRSKEMMMGYKWKYFCLSISFLGWIILGTFTCGIGLLWVIPYMEAANAVFYLEVSGQNTEDTTNATNAQYEYNYYDE